MSTETTVKPSEAAQYAVFSEPIQIAEDVSCCLKVNAVIAKEGIYTFPAGPNNENVRCLWSRQELLKATPTARAAKITINGHPPGKVVTKQTEMYGVVEKPFFDRDRIRATLNYDKAITPPEVQEQIRVAAASKDRKDATEVSIGFYYASDFTSGVWHGEPYDMVMRDIVVDHVATVLPASERGRCQYPNCGIGVSSEEVTRFVAASQKAPVSAAVETPAAVAPPAPVVVAPPPIEPTQPAVVVKQFKAVDTNIATADLINRGSTLLKMFEHAQIEKLRNDRRHPT